MIETKSIYFVRQIGSSFLKLRDMMLGAEFSFITGYDTQLVELTCFACSVRIEMKNEPICRD